jgi:hypothetical protein
MAQTKSTRVVFREETICNYTDTKFLQSNPQCSIREISSVVEEFDPITIRQEHFDFVLRRNEAVPQPLVPHSSTNPVSNRKDIMPPLTVDTYIDRIAFDQAEVAPPLRAGRQNIPNMSNAIDNVINRIEYANRLSQLNEEGVGLQELPDKSNVNKIAKPTETPAEKFNRMYENMIQVELAEGYIIPSAPESMTGMEKQKYIMDEIIRSTDAEGRKIVNKIGTAKETTFTADEAYSRVKSAYDKAIVSDPFGGLNDYAIGSDLLNNPFGGLGDFVTGSDLTVDQQETLRMTAEIEQSTMKARARKPAKTKLLIEEAVPTSKTEGVELSNLRLTNKALEKGYGKQTDRGSAGQGSSNDPIAPPTDVLNINMLTHSLPLDVLQVSFEMPPELQNLKIPNMPDPTKATDTASYRLEKSIYETKLAELFKAIDGSYKIDNYTKQIIKKQLEIHQEEVNLRAKIANNPAIIEDITPMFGGEFNQPNLINLETTKFESQLNKLFVEQQIYSELRGIPTAERAVTILEMQSNSSNFSEYFSSRSGATISQGDFAESLTKVSDVMASFELANPPVTQIQPQQQASISNTLKSIKYSETFKSINATALGEALGHTIAGMTAAMIIAHFAGESQIFKNIEDIYVRGAAIGATVGGAGALPTIASRFFVIATRNAITIGGETALAATSRALVRGAITSIGEIVAGGIVGAALVPLDMLFQDFLLKNGFTHAGAGALSGATMAGIGTVASLAIGATVESIAAGALTLGAALAPASLGLSVVVALGTMAFAAIVGATMGWFGDDRARRDRDTHNINRRWILENLAKNNFNVIETFHEFERQKYQGRLATNKESDDDFGDYETDARPFIEMLLTKFEGRSFPHSNINTVSLDSLSDKEKKIQELMARDLLPTVRDLALKDGHPEIAEAIEKLPDYNPISGADWEWLDQATDKTWYRDSLLSGQIQYEELKFTQIKSADAQQQLYRIWDETHTLEYPPELVVWAAKDSSFATRFTQSRIYDAQRIIMENFQENGKLFEENQASLIAMACTKDPTITAYIDPDGIYGFRRLFTDYTNNMQTTADSMNITIPQLLSLQNLPVDRRERAFLTYQYNTLRENTLTRDEVENLQRYDEENRAIAARGFYSRDDEILTITPVEEYGTWNPADAQIWRAQEAGMTLRQYVDYMHLLSMGDRGDINNLPEYSPAEVTRQRQEDRIAFQRQLDLTNNSDLLIYDEATQRFVINYNIYITGGENIVERMERMNTTNMYYSPTAYQSDENFHTMISGMNEENQQTYDAYNFKLAGDLEQYRGEYERQVAEYNDYQHITGQQNFLYFDATAEYHARRLTYDPMSTDPNDYITKPSVDPPRTKPDPYEIKNGRPPRLTTDDNIEALLNDENKELAQEQIDKQTLETGRELSYNERQYIFKQAFNKQYYESQEERDYWDARSQMMARLDFANRGLDPNSATDADRADNLHMELAQYYEYIGTLPRNNQAFFNPDEHKDDLVKEAEEQIDDGAINIEDGKNYYNGIESDDREEERMINADRANARGDDGLYDNIISGSYDTNIDVGGGNP